MYHPVSRLILPFAVSVALAVAASAAAFPARAQGQEQSVTLHVERSGLRSVCDTLIRAFGVPLVYLDRDVRPETVSVHCDDCTVGEVLDRALASTRLSWKRVNRQYILSPGAVPAPRPGGSVWGTVLDSSTGELVADALVLLYPESGEPAGDRGTAGPHMTARGPGDPGETHLAPLRSVPANGSGFFAMRNVPAGRYRAVARMVGYNESATACVVPAGAGVELTFRLAPDQIFMKEVVVSAERSAFSIAGGPGGGISRGVFVPAAPADQNQYFLEGERIYNPSHHGGVVGTFNEDALNDVDTRRGGIPSYYGGRIGGILDLSLREGSTAGISGAAGLGSLGASLSLNGPIVGGSSFMISGRQGYPDISGAVRSGARPVSDAHSSELISKLTVRASGTDRIYLTGYFGRDVYRNAPAGPAVALRNEFTWRNAASTVRWTGVLPPALFLQVQAGFTGYDLGAAHLWTDLGDSSVSVFNSVFRIGDATLRADAEHFYDDWHTITGGAELVRHAMSGDVSLFTSQIARLPWSEWSAWELAVYMQDRWRLGDDVLAEIGARATSFLGRDGSHSAVDPRFSLFVSPAADLRFRAALTSVTQFLHPYRNSGVFLFYPSIFWYPSTERVKPSSSMQGLAGVERSFGGGSHSVAADVYYRLTRNIHEFYYEQAPATDPTLDDAILSGDEKAWGVQVTLGTRGGRVDGLVRYNLSWLTHRFDSLNGGVSFVPRFHRRHEVVADIGYEAGDGWIAGIVASVASDQSPSFSQQVRPQLSGVERGAYDLNGSRLPGFERLELRITRVFRLASGTAQATLRLLNDYGLLDPYEWRLVQTGDLRQRWQATLRQGSIIPRYPAIAVVVNF